MFEYNDAPPKPSAAGFGTGPWLVSKSEGDSYDHLTASQIVTGPTQLTIGDCTYSSVTVISKTVVNGYISDKDGTRHFTRTDFLTDLGIGLVTRSWGDQPLATRRAPVRIEALN